MEVERERAPGLRRVTVREIAREPRLRQCFMVPRVIVAVISVLRRRELLIEAGSAPEDARRSLRGDSRAQEKPISLPLPRSSDICIRASRVVC